MDEYIIPTIQLDIVWLMWRFTCLIVSANTATNPSHNSILENQLKEARAQQVSATSSADAQVSSTESQVHSTYVTHSQVNSASSTESQISSIDVYIYIYVFTSKVFVMFATYMTYWYVVLM